MCQSLLMLYYLQIESPFFIYRKVKAIRFEYNLYSVNSSTVLETVTASGVGTRSAVSQSVRRGHCVQNHLQCISAISIVNVHILY